MRITLRGLSHPVLGILLQQEEQTKTKMLKTCLEGTRKSNPNEEKSSITLLTKIQNMGNFLLEIFQADELNEHVARNQWKIPPTPTHFP